MSCPVSCRVVLVCAVSFSQVAITTRAKTTNSRMGSDLHVFDGASLYILQKNFVGRVEVGRMNFTSTTRIATACPPKAVDVQHK